MTSKSLYSNYFKNTLKRKSWSTALSSLIFFLTLTLPALMIMGENAVKSTNEYENILNAENVSSSLTSLMDNNGISVKLGFIFLSIIAGISSFSYLHNKAKVDFYHSFPITRKQIFVTNFVVSIIPVLIGFLINFIVTNILIASFGYGEEIMTVEIFKALVENILYFISTFSIISLCAILCGNTVITLILSCVALFGQSAIYLLFEALKGILYSTYYSDSTDTMMHVFKLSPITQIFNTIIRVNPEQRLSVFLTYIVVTAIIIAIALGCFIKRKSEHSGMAIAFDKFKLPLKIYCCIIFALGFGILFREIVYQNIWIYFGLIFGILLAHALSEITFEFSFKSITKNWKHGIILSVICCAVVLGMNFDITGFDSRIVKSNQIKSFGIENNGYYNYNRNTLRTRNLDTPENIKTIAELMKRAVTFDSSSDVEQLYFTVAVDKKTFGTFKRTYSIEKSDENIALFNRIRYSKEYKKKTNDIFSENLEKAENIIVKPKSSNLEQDFSYIKHSKVEHLLNVLREDYLNLTAKEGFNTSPVFVVKFEVSHDSGGYALNTFPIYESYTNTLALLKEYGIEQKQLNADDIEKITIYESQIENIKHWQSNDKYWLSSNSDNVVTFTNKNDIERLIKNAAPDDIISNIDSFTNTNKNYQLMIYFKDDNDPQTFYTKDSEDILEVIK